MGKYLMLIVKLTFIPQELTNKEGNKINVVETYFGKKLLSKYE